MLFDLLFNDFQTYNIYIFLYLEVSFVRYMYYKLNQCL